MRREAPLDLVRHAAHARGVLALETHAEIAVEEQLGAEKIEAFSLWRYQLCSDPANLYIRKGV